MSINKVMLLGNVGQNPDLRQLGGDTKVARFSLATSEVFKAKDGTRSVRTDWHSITAWSRTAEYVEKYVGKGDHLYVEGRLRISTYTDRDGVEKRFPEIIADNVQLISKKQDGAAAQTAVANQASATEPEESDGDMPF